MSWAWRTVESLGAPGSAERDYAAVGVWITDIRTTEILSYLEIFAHVAG